MDNTQHVVHATLVIKASTRGEAELVAVAKLNKWFMEEGQQEVISGYGFPDGSLLNYRIGRENVALATSPVVQPLPLAEEDPYPPIEFTHSG